MTDTLPAAITVWIWRGTREQGAEQPYRVELEPGMVVLDAVHYVQARYAPDLAVRWNCKAAHCGSCGAEVNGRPRLLCKTRLDDYVRRGEEVHLRPMKTFPVVRDLVPDVGWNYRTARRIPAFRPADAAPFRLWQRDVDRIQEFRRCIECFLCQDVCHVLREHGLTERYMGPRYMAKLAERAMHPADEVDRIPFVRTEGGIDWCNVTRCCSEVCPEAIEITGNAIIPLKERVADRYWDPVRRLVRGLAPREGQEPPRR